MPAPQRRSSTAEFSEAPLAEISALGPVDLPTRSLNELVQGADITPLPPKAAAAAQRLMENTKPLKKSRTAQSSLIVVLLAIWGPLMLVLDALFGLFGVPLDTAGYAEFADDGAISTAEILVITRDVVMAALAGAAIYFRKAATATIKGVFSRN